MSGINHRDSKDHQDRAWLSDDRRQKMKALSELIDAELEKPDEEIDAELLMQYQMLLAELTASELPTVEDDLENKLEKIKKEASATEPEAKKKKAEKKLHTAGHYRVAIRIAAVVAAVLIAAFATLTVTAKIQGYDSAWDFVMENIGKIRGLLPGDSVNDDGITLVKPTGTETYSSIAELLEKEDLHILYPAVLPEGVQIKQVKLVYEDDEKYTVLFVFSDKSLNYTAINYKQLNLDINQATICTVENTKFYILREPLKIPELLQ